jgi:hypothetical protein
LSFAEIQDRELKIDAAHNRTFKWIASQDTIVTETDALRFETWLDSPHRGLFISGKAASGKSTLMKHLRVIQAPLIQRSQWASSTSSVIFATFFFYERGTDLQKSREGMLRSLVHQILLQIPMKLFDTKTSLRWHNLTAILHSAIEGLEARGKKLFLFLDGLDEFRMLDKIDEYTDEQKDLIYDGGNNDAAWGVSTWIFDGYREISIFVLELCKKKNVKVCFSCRELSVFEGKFGGLPRLQLQKHTRNDIYRYTHGRLSMEAPDLPDLDSFASTIADKASGVFLWVRLVVNLLINGHDDGDSTQELWSTLEHLPDRLGGENGLYMSMLRHIRERHKPESARLFRLVAAVKDPLHLLHLSFAADSLAEVHTNGHGSCIQIDKIGHSGFSTLCETLSRRLKSRCGGLLEADPFVNFMHQTAREFMQRQFAKEMVFGGELKHTNINLSSAIIEGSIALIRVAERLSPTNTSDLLWKDPGQALLSTSNTFDHIRELDHSCIDTDSYISLVNRLNGTESMKAPVFEHRKFLGRWDHRDRGPWFSVIETKRFARTQEHWSEGFMPFAAITDLNKYIDFKLDCQAPSRRIEEACQLWKYCFPSGRNDYISFPERLLSSKDKRDRQEKSRLDRRPQAFRRTQGVITDSMVSDVAPRDDEWLQLPEQQRELIDYEISDYGISFSTCKSLLTHIARSDNSGTKKISEICLSGWADVLLQGCEYFKSSDKISRYTYGKDWLELILLMLKSGVSVNTPIGMTHEDHDGIVYLQSSEILNRIIEAGRALPVRDITLNHLESQVLEWLPGNMTSQLVSKDWCNIDKIWIRI